MPDSDAWLRHHLMLGEYGNALSFLDGKRGVPGDRLWRALQRALVLHHAGDFRASNEAFHWAETEADLRYTRSAGRAAGSMVVNDNLLAYMPSASEMGMIPYYRMLNYLALDDLESAAVEARKANALIARQEGRGDSGCREDAMIRYLAGLVLSSAGDVNDALVALRHAELGFRGCAGDAGLGAPSAIGVDLVRVARTLGISEVADSAAERYAVTSLPSAGGELLLLVEHGFVAYRVEEALHVPIYPTDINGLGEDDEDGIMAAAARIMARLAGSGVERARWGSTLDDHPISQLAHALEGAHVLRLAWPASRRSVHGPEVRVWVNDSLVTVTRVGDLSYLSESELDAQRLTMATRMVARGMARYLVSREAEKATEKKHGEVAGFVIGRLTNLMANELERADTRSWSLLPDQVSMVRAHLPVGNHRVRLEVFGEGGELLEARDLGTLTVAAGDLVLRSERVWGGDLAGRW
ncbi:hypothetical protein BH23GEM8_BH23GEM8_17400 [soil metagenome]